MTQYQAIKKTRSFVQKARRNGINITQTFLFGSYAKKTANEKSDIDVGVVIPYIKDRFNKEVKLKLVASKIDDRIEPVVLTKTDLQDRYYTLASEIRKYGISI